MKLVIGLGNPGKKYRKSRHNIGFMVVEKLARKRNVVFKKLFCFPARQARCRIGRHEARLIEPTSFMNCSGKVVCNAMKKWRVSPESSVVVYDDIDLEFGIVRVRAEGSGGSHNGMKSILEWLQTKKLPRVRVGIGPRPSGAELTRFVLDDFSEQEYLKLEGVVERAADAVEKVFCAGIERSMNEFNRLNK